MPVRKLMWFTVGFAVSCVLTVYLLPFSWILPAAGISLFLCTIAFLCKQRLPVAVLIGMSAGFIFFSLFCGQYLNIAKNQDGMLSDIQITASGYDSETDYGIRFDGTVIISGEKYGVRVYINEPMDISPGDVVKGKFLLRYTPPGGRDESIYHAGNGIFLLAYQRGVAEYRIGEDVGLFHYPAIFAQEIKTVIHRIFPQDVTGIVQALLLGDSTELDYQTETALKISGIRHIIAVSGLHVTLLYSLIQTITLRRRFLSAFLAFPVLLFFSAMAGFTPSVVRACIMVGLMLLAQVCNKEYDPPTALAFSVLVMLAVNPFVISSAGFQLTVGCVAGIQLFADPIGDWMKSILGTPKGKGLKSKILRWTISSVLMSIGAMSLTTPLCALYFGSVSLVGVLTNLLTIWVINWIFYGVVVLCALSYLSVTISSLLGWLLAWLIRYVLWIAKFLASFPLAAVYTKSPYIVVWLIFVYLLAGFILLQHKKHPVIFACCMTISLSMALLCSWIEPLLDHARMTVMDVGQGQSIILQSGSHTFLVDCGGDSDETAADTAAETLLSMGIYRLDAIILTHGDRDHAGGIMNLLSRIETDRILLGADNDQQLIAEIRSAANGEVMEVTEDLHLTTDKAEITVFAPLFVDKGNENSLCVLFDAQKCAILITGDRGNLGEMMLMRDHEIPNVDVLVAGHHGSKYATTDALLQQTDPEIVVISVSADNLYGHPAPETLERLEKYGCRVYRTDVHGTIIYRR